jgi:hypothetical protein
MELRRVWQLRRVEENVAEAQRDSVDGPGLKFVV